MSSIQFTGLTDAEVLESRRRFGANILTPPPQKTLLEKMHDCFHFWFLRFLVIFLLLLSVTALLLSNSEIQNSLWKAVFVVFLLTLFVFSIAFLGGEYDAKKKHFQIDSLVTILLFALFLSCGIAYYQDVFLGVVGMQPYLETLGIALAILLATGVAYLLERQNEKTFQSLNAVNDETLVKAIRGGQVCEIGRKDVVVGDIILLETGEEIPADARLLQSTNLIVNESSLTGELQANKTANPEFFDAEATYPSNHIMKGCMVIEGHCVAEVFAVGDATASGKVFHVVQVQEGSPTPLSLKLDRLAALITKVSYAIAALIIVGRVLVFFLDGKMPTELPGVVGFVKYLLETIMIAVTLIVVAVPEGLPMAVTLSLAFSMKRMMRQNMLPRTIHACETMGATSIICTDKTGTLTQNQMQVYEIAMKGLDGGILQDNEFSHFIKENICINSTANLEFLQDGRVKSVGNPTEGALLLWLHNQQFDYLPLRAQNEIIEQLPFSTERKFMATVVVSPTAKKRVVYVKGAPEIVLAMCHLDVPTKKWYEERLIHYQNKAMRTLALAYAVLENDDSVIRDNALTINDLSILGVVAISDPVRAEVPHAISECLRADIQVKIITGDTSGTAKEIGRQVGIWQATDDEKNILTGKQLETMSDYELRVRLPQVKIISRARPHDKERAVRLLKSLGAVVAVTGDGTNDAPALNVANVGLSMGDGTAVAKEASDITIMDNSFSTIANAVMWGRSLYRNIKRFILFQMTINVVACLVVLVGAFMDTESPLSVTQMLWVNLIMDTFAALALASLPPQKEVMQEKPRPINEHILKGIDKRIISVGLIFTALLLSVLAFFKTYDVTSLTAVQDAVRDGDGLTPYELTIFFTLFVMLQFWNLFNAKAFQSEESAFAHLHWRDSGGFMGISLLILVGQILIVQFGGEMFNVVRGGIAPSDWLTIILGTSVVLWAGEIVRFVKKMSKK